MPPIIGNTTTTGEATATPLTGGEWIRGVQSGANVKMTAQAIADLGYTSPASATGDLIVHSGGADQRLAVGTNTWQLVADSTDPLGVKWYDAVGAFRTTLVANAGASLIGFIQSGSGTAGRTLQDKARERVSVNDFTGADPTGTTDSYLAIMAADACLVALGGGTLHFDGNYKFATGLVLSNKNQYEGRSMQGTVLNYTGTGDAVSILNPINGSTLASIRIRHLTINGPNIAALHGCIYDRGSSLVELDSVFLNPSNANTFGLIMDQSELWQVRNCYFAGANGVWIVNGTDRSGTALIYFTNRLKFESCQFNVNGICVVDDGGNDHTFDTCNWNASTTWIRASGVNGLNMRGGEWENSSAVGITFKATKWQGAAGITGSVATLNGGDFSQPLSVAIVSVDPACLQSFVAEANVFNTAGAVFQGLDNCSSTHLVDNFQASTGDGFTKINNVYSAKAANVTVTAAGGGFSLGNGTITAVKSRVGRDLLLSVLLTVGSTTNMGTGNLVFSEDDVSAGLGEIGSALYLCGSGIYCGVVLADSPSGGMTCFAATNTANAVSGLIPATWVAGNTLRFKLTYTALHQVG